MVNKKNSNELSTRSPRSLPLAPVVVRGCTAMGLFAEICGGWTYRKTLWWSWIWNALIAFLFSGSGITVAQKLNKLDWVTNAATGEVDETSEKLVGGLVANISWGIILNALFLIFSVVVLLRKVRPRHRENSRRVQRRTTPMIAPEKRDNETRGDDIPRERACPLRF